MNQKRYTHRDRLLERMDRLNIGYDEALDDMNDDALEEMVCALEEAQAIGDINLETSAGVDHMAYIVDYYQLKSRLRTAAMVLGRRGGQAKSEKKAQASRENGKLGGRPKKNNENKTCLLERFDHLGVGYDDTLYLMDKNALEGMVEALEQAQAVGDLDIEWAGAAHLGWILSYYQAIPHQLSYDNGLHACSIQEMLQACTWEVIVNCMDDWLRERVHTAIAPCSHEEFLEEYRRYSDLIIG